MSDNNENRNEESDSLSSTNTNGNNNNRINNMNLLNSANSNAAAGTADVTVTAATTTGAETQNEPDNANNVNGATAAVMARLREQIQGLKNLSSLKQNLLNIREGQVKELIDKLKFFEEAVANEKVKRGELNERVESAEAECADLAERLRANVAAFDDAKSDYENRIVELISNLEGATAKCDAARARVEELEKKVTDLQAETAAQPWITLKTETSPEAAQAPSTSDIRRAAASVASGDSESGSEAGATASLVQTLKSELKDATEKNRILSYQMTLLNTLFMETEETAIDFNRIRAIGDIVRGSMDLALDPDKENQPESDALPENEGDLLDVAASNGERKVSFDVNGLIEKLDASNQKELQEIPGEESCYKSVDTTAGPKLVLSVSRTFIKLKDLILEKKSLQKEIDGLKELNDKLSVKVDQQERRLYCVSGELNKTWSLVATLKAQHKQLHNSKAVLRYELQEKRKLLEKLKRDLMLSREKWIKVRQKNSESEVEWCRMRDEFARRRTQLTPGGENSQVSQEGSTSGLGLSEEGQPLLQHSTSPSTISDDEQEEEGASGHGRRSSAGGVPPKSPSASRASRKYGPSKSKSTESADVEDNEEMVDADVDGDSEELEALEEGACGIDYAKVAFDDPLDELEDLAEEIKTIEAAAATSGDDEDDDDDAHGGEGEPSGLFNGTELNLERLVNRRATRLAVLEEQCRLLYKKLSASKVKSITLYTKLAKLHNHYGSDTDESATDQSHPTETSDDTAYASGRGESSRSSRPHHSGVSGAHGYTMLGNEADADGDVDVTEMPSEMESHDEQDGHAHDARTGTRQAVNFESVFDTAPVPVPVPVPAPDASEEPINVDNESQALSQANDRTEELHRPSHSHHNVTLEEQMQIASENRELQAAEAVGQSTTNHNLGESGGISRENATIVITDETIEQIARSQNHLIVRNGDVQPPPPQPRPRRTRPRALLPTSQYDDDGETRRSNGSRSRISSGLELEETAQQNSHQNLASALTITNPVVLSTFNEARGHEPLNSSPIPMNPVNANGRDRETSPIPNPRNSTDNAIEGELPNDLSTLGRLIIQQLPKRLEILKHENRALMDELQLADKILKKTEEELQNEKQLSHLLQAQVEQQNLLEGKLHEELDLQSQIIEELKNEIGKGKHCFDNLLSEKQALSDFVQLYNQDKAIHEARFVARLLNRKQCSSCNSKFGIFKKKHNCKICGFDFCSKCSSERKFQEVAAVGGAATEKVKGHACNGCTERRDNLETLRLAATLESNV